LSLPLSDRASLALDLITSIDGTDETEIERLWVAEGERRYPVYKDGGAPSRPAEDVFRDAFERFR